MGKKYWRRSHVRKDGTRVRGGWVRGRNPKAGCSFWCIGLIALATIGWLLT